MDYRDLFLHNFAKEREKGVTAIYKYFYTIAEVFVMLLEIPSVDSKDILSSAVIKLWEKRHSFEDVDDLDKLLFSCLRDFCIQRRSSKPKIEYCTGSILDFDEPAEDEFDLDVEISKDLKVEAIRNSIGLLPNRLRIIFQMNVQDGYPASDISRELNIPLPTIYHHLNRAKAFIRESVRQSSVARVNSLFQTTPNDTFNRLCIRIKNGQLEIIGQHPEGTFLLSDGMTQTVNGIFLFGRSRWAPILKQLELLINKAGLKERELQDFLEDYPDLILGDDYSKYIPQATIVKDDRIRWKADFVLVPHDQLSFSKILELKLPAAKISLKESAGHHQYSQQLIKAIRQLQDYHYAFDSTTTKQMFKEKYRTEVFKPDLQLIIGRRDHIQDRTDFLQLQRDSQLAVIDWDSLYEKLKRKYK